MLVDCKFVVVGDFNVPGDNVKQLDSQVVDVFNLYNLHQYVSVPTHVSGNILDLVLSQDGDVSSPLVSAMSVQSVCFSDHHLLTCHLGVPLTPPVVMTYSYRSLRTMDTAAFWLRMAERTSSVYLYTIPSTDSLPVANMESRRRLRSVTSSDLMVPATRRSTLGDRAEPRAWNNLRMSSVTLHH